LSTSFQGSDKVVLLAEIGTPNWAYSSPLLNIVEFGQTCSIDLFSGHARGSQHVLRFVVNCTHREDDRAKDFDRPIGAEVCKSLNKVF
jgi:hypothetical protein